MVAESNGWVMDAIDHFYWPLSGRRSALISHPSLTWLREGQNQTLRRAIQTSPSEVMDQHALLLCLKVWIAPDQENICQAQRAWKSTCNSSHPVKTGRLMSRIWDV